jgi:hypothetical protein
MKQEIPFNIGNEVVYITDATDTRHIPVHTDVIAKNHCGDIR